MPGEYILDTNIFIALMDRDVNVLRRIQASGEIFFSVIVLGELFYGARNSGRVERNLARIQDVMRSKVPLHCDAFTAEHYGVVKAQLKRSGRPIPENDLWIAAQCLQYDLTLVTRDAHFAQIPGLTVETW